MNEEKTDIHTTLASVLAHFEGDTEAQRLIDELKGRIDVREELSRAIGDSPRLNAFEMSAASDFSDAVDRTIERLALLVNMISGISNKDTVKRGLAHLENLIDVTLKDAKQKSFVTFYERRRREEEERKAVELNNAVGERIIAVNNALRLKTIEEEIARRRKCIESVEKEIAAYDKSDWPVLYAECAEKKRKIEIARDTFLQTSQLPETFRPLRMFEGFPLDQFAFELEYVEGEKNSIERDFRILCGYRDQHDDEIAKLLAEVEMISKGESNPVESAPITEGNPLQKEASLMREYSAICNLNWPVRDPTDTKKEAAAAS